MKITKVILGLIFLLSWSHSLAEDNPSARADDTEEISVPAPIYKIGKNGKIIGISGIANLHPISKDDGCDARIKYLTIDEIAYEGVSEIIGGIRSKGDLYLVDSELMLSIFSNAERSWVKNLFAKGNKVLVPYLVCGSGGFLFIRDIYMASSIEGIVDSKKR